METATRYLTTIEALMIDNSRLNKELEDAVKGTLPSRMIPQEVADQCFNKIASVIGPVANGSLLDEITIICDEFLRINTSLVEVTASLKAQKDEKAAIEHVVKGSDIEHNYTPTILVNNVSRLRAVLEVTRTRLSRFITNGNNELVNLYNEIATFLDGNKDE